MFVANSHIFKHPPPPQCFSVLVCIAVVRNHNYRQKILHLLSEPSSWSINRRLIFFYKYFSLCSTLLHQFKMAFCLTPLVSRRWDWSVNLLHDMFEIFIWGWAVRRCPTHSLLSSRGRQCCQKSYRFHKIWLCFDFYGQQVLCIARLCLRTASYRELDLKHWKC